LLNTQLQEKFEKNIKGIDMVVGAKGSPLQLILSSIYHIDNPTGNIDKQEADALARHPLVAQGIPLAYGDSYQSFRIVGTAHAYVDHYRGALAEGKLYDDDYEVVLGSYVASQLGLSVGDHFYSIHGFNAEMGHSHEENAYEVVGILAPSHSVLDQLILSSVESIWKTHAHAEEEAEGENEAHLEEEHAEPQEITALLLRFRNPMAAIQLPRLVNETTNMQAALPAIEITRLYSLLGVGIDLMRSVAIVIIIISGISIFISLYHSLNERRYELALMRSLGASRWKLFGMILFEGLLLAVLGYLFGMVLSRAGLFLLSGAMENTYRYSFDRFGVLTDEIGLLGVALLIGCLAALIPAISAYRTHIARTLSYA